MADVITIQNNKGIVKTFIVKQAQLRENLTFMNDTRRKTVVPYGSFLSCEIAHGIDYIDMPSGVDRDFKYEAFSTFLKGD